MRLLKIAVAFYVIGALGFLMQANFDIWTETLQTIYYVWAKGKDVLLFIAILYLLKPNQRWIIKPLILYSSINLLWEILRPLTNLDINHPVTVTVVFTVLLLGVITFLIKDLLTLRENER